MLQSFVSCSISLTITMLHAHLNFQKWILVLGLLFLSCHVCLHLNLYIIQCSKCSALASHFFCLIFALAFSFNFIFNFRYSFSLFFCVFLNICYIHLGLFSFIFFSCIPSSFTLWSYSAAYIYTMYVYTRNARCIPYIYMLMEHEQMHEWLLLVQWTI